MSFKQPPHFTDSSCRGNFSRQEYWNGLPFPSPGHLPDPEIEPMYLASPALGVFSTTEPPIVVQLLRCVGLFVTPWSHLESPKKIWRFSKSTDSKVVDGRTFSEMLPIHEWGQGWLSHRLVCFVHHGLLSRWLRPLMKNLLGSINLIKLWLPLLCHLWDHSTRKSRFPWRGKVMDVWTRKTEGSQDALRTRDPWEGQREWASEWRRRKGCAGSLKSSLTDFRRASRVPAGFLKA